MLDGRCCVDGDGPSEEPALVRALSVFDDEGTVHRHEIVPRNTFVSGLLRGPSVAPPVLKAAQRTFWV